MNGAGTDAALSSVVSVTVPLYPAKAPPEGLNARIVTAVGWPAVAVRAIVTRRPWGEPLVLVTVTVAVSGFAFSPPPHAASTATADVSTIRMDGLAMRWVTACSRIWRGGR